MSWFTDFILPFFTILFGGTSFFQFFQLRSMRRKSNAEADSVEVDNWQRTEAITRDQITFLKTQLNNSYSDLEKMQAELSSKRSELLDFMRKVEELERQLINERSARIKSESQLCKLNDCPNRVVELKTQVQHG